jgi:phage anti-repressor protein
MIRRKNSMNELIKTFQNKKGSTVVDGRDLHGFLGVETPYRKWFPRMIEYGFTEDTDFVAFGQKSPIANGGYKEIENHALSLDMAKELSMIQRTEKGKQARKYFIQMEKQAKQNELDTSQLSPELQFMSGVVKKLAANELAQKQMNKKLDGIADIVGTSTMDWRNATSHLINAVVRVQGGSPEAHRTVRNDIYDEVDRRGAVSLSTRLTNLRRRMAEEGAAKSKRDKTSKVDVIGNDKKLIEIYMAVVKDFAIKFGTWKQEY